MKSLQIYIDGEFHPEADAKVSVFDHGLLYGDGIFEGIRFYNGRVFKLTEHLRRLWDSAKAICLNIPVSFEEMEAATLETIRRNELRDGYVRLIVTRGVGNLGLSPDRCKRASIIIIASTIQLYPPEKYTVGMEMVTCSTRRCSPAALSPAVKSLNYLNNILAKVEAIEAGVHEAIMLNTDGEVSECTGDNIFFIRGGRVVTPPVSAGILNGVTRLFVMNEIAPVCGLAVEERSMRLDDLFTADEVFLTGTAAEVIGVSSIDGEQIGEGRVGPVTRRLIAEFKARVAENAPEN
jgi:branched-chain amino acid aminotransferase